jgi:hypothetical protein
MPTTKKTGFAVTCPHCHDTDATISVDLNDLGAILCTSCDETFTAVEACEIVQAELHRWEKVVRWIEAAKNPEL